MRSAGRGSMANSGPKPSKREPAEEDLNLIPAPDQIEGGSKVPVPEPDLTLGLDAHARLDLRSKSLDIRGKEVELSGKINALDAERLMVGVRKKYAWLIFLGCFAWMVFIACLMMTVGVGFKTNNRLFAGGYFVLSEKVLITLITSTTINVLGLFYIVAKWLFPEVNGK